MIPVLLYCTRRVEWAYVRLPTNVTRVQRRQCRVRRYLTLVVVVVGGGGNMVGGGGWLVQVHSLFDIPV